MSPRDHLPGDDPQQDPTVSRLYRELPDVAPSADTDALIRAAARRAVNAGPGRPRGVVAAHWRGLGSTAAALLLGVALTVQWRTQAPSRLDEALATAPAPTPIGTADATNDTRVADNAEAAPEAAAAAPAAPATAPATASRGPGATTTPGVAATAPTDGKISRATTMARDVAVADNAEEMKAAAEAGAPMMPPPAAVAATPVPAESRESMAPAPTGTAPSAPALAKARAEADAPLRAVAPAPAQMEKRLAIAPAAPPPPVAAASAGNVLRQAQSAREQDRAPVAAEPPAARATADRQAAAAPAAAAPAPDYRLALAAGHFAEALDLLGAPDTPDASLDRDLLLQWRQPGVKPACASAALRGDLALLCEGLVARAAGKTPSPAWRANIEAAGLASGEHAYRRGLVEKLFGPLPRP